jgi:AICAR transformylase/IMP cyclohydrolase PurH
VGWRPLLARVEHHRGRGRRPAAASVKHDNVEEAHRHGVRYIAEPGGSIRSGEVRAACERLGITLVQTGVRLFRH